MDGGINTVYGSIFALVRVGFYTTVWYKFIPCNIDIQPDQLLYMSWDYFLNESAIVQGYTKITLQETQRLNNEKESTSSLFHTCTVNSIAKE